MKFGVGQSVRRLEDDRLVTGRGRYTDDLSLPGAAHGVVLRSSHAHATIRLGPLDAARRSPGVLAVITSAELDRLGIGPLPCVTPLTNRDGSTCVLPINPVLKSERVRHVGDPIAFVVAETRDQARDAAELIEVDYKSLPAIADTASALEPGSPQLWPEAPNNLCSDWEDGDAAATDAAFKNAAKVVSLMLVNNRLVVAAMEPRAAIGAYDPSSASYTLNTCTQGVHGLRGILAEAVLKVPPEKLRVVTHDVGGAFGMKAIPYAEQVLTLVAAKQLGRPVKWASERTEAFLTDSQGRDHVSECELALDSDGRFLGLRISTIANLGAYATAFGPIIPNLACKGMQVGCYRVGAAYVRVRSVFTNTVPVDAYRGAGRPEAAYVIERLADHAAAAIGISPDEIRRRNLIRADEMPFQNALGLAYDSGDFLDTLAKAQARADWAGFPARRAASAKVGKARGIGMAYYVETCGGPILGGETVHLRFEENNMLSVLVGTQTGGQGHETAYAQVVGDALGLPPEQVRVLQGDTTLKAEGGGTGGSRSLIVAGSAIQEAARDAIKLALPIAGDELEAAPGDIEFVEGRFRVRGTDRSIGLFEVAKAARATLRRATDGAPGLEGNGGFSPSDASYPNGCHICEIEIDEATGALVILRYLAVDDFGRLINPLLAEGQVHGGLAQGIGQAIFEHTAYDAESGQLLSASFMDYCLPRADDLPSFEVEWNPVPCRNNPLGIKGAGEAGAVAAPPALINAILDALRPHGVTHVDMPVNSETLWRLMQRRAGPGSNLL